jgi:DNA topoisomerase-3
MKVVLAEKPSVARELAQHLGAQRKRDGWFEGRGYQVTWAFGHLAGLKTPDEYDPALKRWSLETLPFIPAHFELKLEGDKTARRQFATIKKLFYGADSLVCATDAGREGELIFRYIVSLAECESKPAQRLWLSSMTAPAIKDAFDALRPTAHYDNLYAAARCRSEADWIVGLNATRNFTVRFGAGGVLWSVGRVQTPVLAMIVGRDDEIRHFTAEAYWELTTGYRGVRFSFVGKGTRERHGFAIEDDAGVVLTQVTGAPLKVEKVTAREEKLYPPRLFDLTSLQRDMNQRYAMSAQVTLDVAQALYENKLITYPRTDSRHLPASMHGGVRQALASLSRDKSDAIDKLNLDKLAKSKRVFDDNKITDHHAIIPTGQLPNGLPPERRKVFDAIVTRLVAVFYPPCVKAVTIVDVQVAGFAFRARGTRIVDPGWTSLYPRKKPSKGGDHADEQSLPVFERGESGPHDPRVGRKETQSPRAFNESLLLGAMETAGKLVDDDELREALKEKGLGTPATRAAMIETLLRRGYIEREKNTLKATDLGRYLISVITDERLKSPGMTGEWEGKLKCVEKGEQDADEFMREIADYIGNLVDTSARPLRLAVLGECPRCGAAVIEGKRAFGCSQWRSGCGFVLPREYRGVTLSTMIVRELLQRYLVVHPQQIDGEARVLRMTASGALEDIDVPVRGRQQRDGRHHRVRGTPGKKHSVAAESAGSAQAKRTGGRSKNTAGKTTTAQLCNCPQCDRPIIEGEKSYACSGWREGCRVTVWKTIAGKKITKSMAAKLLMKGRTQILKGFTSKSGKPFEARLIWQGDRVKFEFSEPRHKGALAVQSGC